MNEGVLVRYLSTIEEVLLLDYGVDTARLYEEAGVKPLSEYKLSDRVPMSYSDQLWGAAFNLSDHMLGMHVGKRVRYTSFASLGHMLVTSKTVGDAIKASCENTAYVGSGSFRVEETSDQMKVTYFPYRDNIPAETCRIEASLLPFSQLGRLAAEPAIPSEVWLKREKPENADDYARMFNAPVHFAAASNSIFWQQTSLDLCMTEANPSLHETLLRHVKKELENPFTMKAQLKELLENWFAARLPADFSVQTAARALALSTRSLQRKLEEEKTTFRSELLRCRLQKAQTLLQETNLPVSAIAEHLGYAEPAPFVRSFKKHKGLSPAQFRAVEKKTLQ